MFERLACRTSAWFAAPWAVVLVPLLCGAWVFFGRGVDTLTLLLSVAAISTTQLVLVAQARTERVVLAALRELVRAVPEADESVTADVHK